MTADRTGRRAFLRRSVLAGAAALGARPLALLARAPAIIQSDADRPALPQGVATGMAGADRAVVWSRSDRAARMFVEDSTTESFRDVKRVAGPAALDASDFTARISSPICLPASASSIACSSRTSRI